MNIRTALLATALTLAAGLCQAQATIDQNKALAGNINPGDAPGFPVTLSVPGHYKLMSNLVVAGNVNAIAITAPNITLDLNGFTIAGPVTCTKAVEYNPLASVICTQESNSAGVRMDWPARGTVLRNGTVQGFNYGVIGIGSESIDRLRVTQNRTHGIWISGAFNEGSVISEAAAYLNGQAGIAARNTLIERSRVADNGTGIVGEGTSLSRVLVVESLVRTNRSTGVENAVIRGSVVFNNGTDLSGVTTKD